ncbi:hypothetical protein [Nitrosomonas mobilis]|uniref:RlpA-like protein n=1 Tax=Nitrosomonas mobilis TaxID=51642 RepID=A0A1G5SEJ3_9PROT
MAETGTAAHFSDEFQERKNVSGKIFEQNQLIFAHKKLPFSTEIKVVNLKTTVARLPK